MDVALPAMTAVPVAHAASTRATSAPPVYEDGPVRILTLAAVLWGVVGMAVGVLIASQLTWPELNFVE